MLKKKSKLSGSNLKNYIANKIDKFNNLDVNDLDRASVLFRRVGSRCVTWCRVVSHGFHGFHGFDIPSSFQWF